MDDNFVIDDEILNNSERAQRAMNLFKEGYNCSQAIVLAFSDLCDIDEKTALKLSSSFGGGMGRLREVCGAVSGMFMVAGMLYGYDEPKAFEKKSEHYSRIQKLAGDFSANTGSIVCHVMLGLGEGKDSPIPEQRTDSYYKKRPCVKIIGTAAAVLEDYIKGQTNYEDDIKIHEGL